MSYHKQYYKDHPELKEKQKLRYASLTGQEKKDFLNKQKEKRAKETSEQRETRLASQRMRYQKNREDRLMYQKKYNQNKNEKIKSLEKEIKELKSSISKS